MKHKRSGWFEVVGWRPPSRSHPAGGVVLAEDDTPAGTANPAFGAVAREALRRLVARYGVLSDGPVIRLPVGVQARVDYLERSARGLLREAVARELRPALPT